ncbi:hypothetical protein [Aequorivita capsosiphonis]|uniref:hypothetical protein n=1 Tax=Aequorivita capsosiphonis TaxID=487317 RepID=UPI0004134943|nr:hypothetical protein [Aequorivita capsosiphonis]
MAPYKLEDNIREKLEAREIKPSAGAWEKLETKLNAEQPKKKNVGWYYMAASFVGILILASVFFSQTPDEPKSQIVKETIELKTPESKSEIVTENSEVVDILSEENNAEKDNTEAKKNDNRNPLKPVPQKKSPVERKYERDKVIAKTTDQEKQSPDSETQIANEEDALFNQKIDEVVASVKNLQENNNEVTAREVEQLLTDARRDIQAQRILKTPKVDATALLQDVEWELEKSFRDKVFDALGEGFRKIRTAVIERNE